MKKFNTLKVSDIRRETPNTVSICFDVPNELKEAYGFKAGQHVILRREIGGEDVRRTYSLCTMPGSGQWRVAVRGVPEGVFSTFANQDLKIGDTLEVGRPIGPFFYEPESDNNNYIGFAAGSGITPILAILKTVLDSEPNSSFTLFYGNRDRVNTIFLEELFGLKNTYMDRLSLHFFMSKQAMDGELFNGRIDKKSVEGLLANGLCPKDADTYFVCGPSQMMDDVQEGLEAASITKSKIKSERFYAGADNELSEDLKSSVAEASITIIQDGIKQTIDYAQGDGSILDAGTNAGLELSFSCKGGVCATCRAKVIEGDVDQALNYGLEQEELDAGFILTCQSTPKTKNLVLSFDE